MPMGAVMAAAATWSAESPGRVKATVAAAIVASATIH
jgi:hypothetical protein